MKRIYQIIFSTVKGFIDDGCNLRAAALTYFTLMSIVPVLAVALGLARGFGFAKILESVVEDQLREQPEIAQYIINFAYSLLETTSSGVIAGIGVILLLWSVYNILGNIEEALNNIWRIPNPRSWVRKITDYVTAIIMCPLFFVVSSSLTIYLKTHFTDVNRWGALLESGLIHLTPYLLTWMLFTFLYFFLPNRRIPVKYGLIGVFVAGTAYQLLQAFYITVQLKLSSFGAVYGSFAALPLFLIWLNLSWMIVLAGAELAYQAEISDWRNSPGQSGNLLFKTSIRVLALMVVYVVVKAFHEGKEPYSIHQLSEKFGVSKKNLDDVIQNLVKHKIISETMYEADSDRHYQPARDLSALTLKTVVDVFPPDNKTNISVYKNSTLPFFEEKLKAYERLSSESTENIKLSEIIL
jgi:membrane protein